MASYALGLIETKGLIGAIEACDAAAKAAEVVVASAELTPGALVTLKIEGDLGAVQAAVEAGARAAERIGELVSKHVIPRPDDNLEPITPPQRYVTKYHPDDTRPALTPADDHRPQGEVRRKAPPKRPPSQPKPEAKPKARPTPPPVRPTAPEEPKATLAALEAMPVVKLRQFARTVKNLPIQGRQISMANKTQLIDAIKSVMDLE